MVVGQASSTLIAFLVGSTLQGTTECWPSFAGVHPLLAAVLNALQWYAIGCFTADHTLEVVDQPPI